MSCGPHVSGCLGASACCLRRGTAGGVCAARAQAARKTSCNSQIYGQMTQLGSHRWDSARHIYMHTLATCTCERNLDSKYCESLETLSFEVIRL